MKYLNFMGVNIPIIKELELTGSTPAWSVDVNSLGMQAGDAFSFGTYCGEADTSWVQPPGRYEPNTPPPTICSAGSLDLHNGWRIRARGPQYTSASYNQRMQWYADGPETTARNGLLDVSVGHATHGGYQVHRSIETRIFAFSYVYPNAPSEDQQRKSYTIATVWRLKVDDTPEPTISYHFNNSVLDVPVARLNKEYNADLYVEEEDAPFEPSDPQPYDPNPDDTSDEIEIPDDPDVGVTNAGFINVYNPSKGGLRGLGDVLFPNVATATDIVDAVLKLCMVISNQNLINYVIDCHVIPAAPVTSGTADIKVGYVNTAISAAVVSSDYVTVSCGSLSIPEYFGAFLDYGSNTRIKLYLPFVGFVDMKPEFVQSGTLAVDYKFNVIDGSFMAYVRATSSKSQLASSVIGQFAGNACMHFPITGANYSAMVSGIIGAAVAPPAVKGASAVLGSAQAAANSVAAGPDVQQSNGYSSTAALLGIRTPYLMIERPKQAYPGKYAHDKGYPSNISTSLATVSGFTTIEDIDLSGIPLTQAELEELRGLLKEGVYF